MVKSPRWLLLTHQLPAEPSNVRVKVWRKLQSLGALPIKNSVYALPNRSGTREDFEWLRKEILLMKGDASVFLADSISDIEDREIVKGFQEARAKEYEELIGATKMLKEQIENALEGGHIKEEILERLEKQWNSHKLDWEHLKKIDFFTAPNRSKAEAILATVQSLFQRAKEISMKDVPAPPSRIDIKSLKGQIWVTRTSPHVDRLATAWLVRRFVDAKARFKFVTEPYKSKTSSSEIRFDMSDGEFTHFGDWCTFETLLYRLNLKEKALQEIAEIVHDIDLKDRKFERLEAPGVGELLRGLCKLHKDDFERLEAGIVLFDALYESLKEK